MQVPECNSSWSDGHIRQYSAADISVAVNTDRGLLTPIVFGADSKSISDINADVRSLCVSVRRAAPVARRGSRSRVSHAWTHCKD